MTADAAQALMAFYRQFNMPIPPNIIANSIPKDLNTEFNELLQHDFWKNTTIPLYVNQSHMPFDVNPVVPSDWFYFFLA